MSDRIEAVRNALICLGWTADSSSVSFLAEGEYHENWRFSFTSPCEPAQDAVFRINHGSQLDLRDQISYEYRVLEAVEPSGRTPPPLALASDHTDLGKGSLAMGYIDGQPLDYQTDSLGAAVTLARIHASALLPEYIIRQTAPLSDVAKECRRLHGRTKSFPKGAERALSATADKLDHLQNETGAPGNGPLTVCNTEVNSGNWIKTDSGCCLVDWEKAVVSDPVQDIAHFVSPTTTLWKSEFQFDEEGKQAFIGTYWDTVPEKTSRSLDELIHCTGLMERAVRLRGVSWCLMAYEEYEAQGRTLVNEDTREKLHWYRDSWEELLLG